VASTGWALLRPPMLLPAFLACPWLVAWLALASARSLRRPSSGHARQHGRKRGHSCGVIRGALLADGEAKPEARLAPAAGGSGAAERASQC